VDTGLGVPLRLVSAPTQMENEFFIFKQLLSLIYLQLTGAAGYFVTLIMDYQLIMVILVFFLALIYTGRMVYKSMSSESGCASNCGKCAADFSEIKLPGSKNP